MTFLRQKMSYRTIVKQVKQMGYSVSIATIYRIRHGKGGTRENAVNWFEKGKIKKRPTATTPDVVRKIENFIKKVNPPTQKEMAAKCGVSVGTVNRIIHSILKAKLRKNILYTSSTTNKLKNVIPAVDGSIFV